MIQKHDFNTSATNVVELELAEIEQVDGGFAPLIAIAYIGIGMSSATLAGGGFLLGLHLSQH